MELVAEIPAIHQLEDYKCERCIGWIIDYEHKECNFLLDWYRALPIITSVFLAILLRASISYIEGYKKMKKKTGYKWGCFPWFQINDALDTKKKEKNRPYLLVLERSDSRAERNVKILQNSVFQCISKLDRLKQEERIMSKQTLQDSMQDLENKTTPEETLYTSQLCYENGNYMCTPACILFATAVVGMEVCDCPPTEKQMNCIMDSASKIQTQLLSNDRTNHMFSIRDVIKSIRIPNIYHCLQLVGSIARLPPDFITTFEDENDDAQKITDLYHAVMDLKDNTTLVITLKKLAHTVAIYRESRKKHWLFDPLIAVVRDVGDSNIALFELFKVARSAEEFTGLILSKNDTDSSIILL